MHGNSLDSPTAENVVLNDMHLLTSITMVVYIFFLISGQFMPSSLEDHPFRFKNRSSIFGDLTNEHTRKNNYVKANNVNRENVTILSVTNTGFVDFAQNWLYSLHLLNKTFKIKLLTEDEGAFRILSKVTDSFADTKIRLHVRRDKNGTTRALSYSSKAYSDLVTSRSKLILRELMVGQDVLFVDIDAVWLKDPLPLIWSMLNDFDVIVAIGRDRQTPCPCFLYLKSSLVTLKMVRDWVKRLERLNASPVQSKHEHDMAALGVILDKYSTKCKLRLHKLNHNQFPTGDLYFKTPIFYDNHKKEVYVVHGNGLGQHSSKLFFFKLFNVWYADNWEYRNSPMLRLQ